MCAASADSTPVVLLLRGINVGGNNRLPMATLRGLLEELGCTGVSTYLQSGNAVCVPPPVEPGRLAADVEASITAALGLSVRVLARGRDELARVVTANPLPEATADGARYFVTFLKHPVEQSRFAGVDPTGHQPDRFAVGEREVYLWCPNGLSNSELPKVFSDRRLGVTTTTRNWNTVTRLVALSGG